MKTIKQITILVLILITLFASGCTDSSTQDAVTETVAQDEAPAESFEEVVENVTMQEPEPVAEPEKTDKQIKAELVTRLQEDGYNVTAVEVYNHVYSGSEIPYLVFRVDSKETARYELVNMSVIGYDYFPDTERFGAKSRSSSAEEGGSHLYPAYYLSWLDLESYIRGDVELHRVPVKPF